MSAFEDLLARELEHPAARAAFEDSRARHGLIELMVETRKRLALTQKDVADAMGVKQPTISGFETEDSDPRLSTLQRYARALDCEIVIAIRPAYRQSWIDRARSVERRMLTATCDYVGTGPQAVATQASNTSRADFALAY